MTMARNVLYTRVAVSLCLACLVAVSVEAEPQPRSSQARNAGRIVNGEFAKFGDGPWAVSIRRPGDANDQDSWIHFCGGSFVSPYVYTINGTRAIEWRHDDTKPRWVLTAAHCVIKDDGSLFRQPEELTVLGGALNRSSPEVGEVQRVTDIFHHEDYDQFTLANDIAVLRLASAQKDPHASQRASIRLPSVADTSWVNERYLAVRAQGWGNTEAGSDSLRLKEVLLPLVERDFCRSKFGIHGWRIGDGMLCAGFSSGDFDACQGDSGGPLVYRAEGGGVTASRSQDPVLLGVVSWGIGCGTPDLFGVYTSVSFYRRWIEEQVLEFSNTETEEAGQ